MSLEVLILIAAYCIVIAMLLVYTPRNRIREAWVIFLFKQTITWIIGVIVVELRMIEYPVRSFPYALRSSFDFEYFIYPAICVVFNLNYPEKRKPLYQFMHYVYYCSIMTAIEKVLEVYTDLAVYLYWEWYVTWITLFITFYLSRQFYLWFFRLKRKA